MRLPVNDAVFSITANIIIGAGVVGVVVLGVFLFRKPKARNYTDFSSSSGGGEGNLRDSTSSNFQSQSQNQNFTIKPSIHIRPATNNSEVVKYPLRTFENIKKVQRWIMSGSGGSSASTSAKNTASTLVRNSGADDGDLGTYTKQALATLGLTFEQALSLESVSTPLRIFEPSYSSNPAQRQAERNASIQSIENIRGKLTKACKEGQTTTCTDSFLATWAATLVYEPKAIFFKWGDNLYNTADGTEVNARNPISHLASSQSSALNWYLPL